jgi:hypothetical protein
MIAHWRWLKGADQDVFRSTVAFAEKRLAERATVEWALRLKTEDAPKRLALLYVLNHAHGQDLQEPWLSAWRLLEESWETLPFQADESLATYDVAARLGRGERTGSLISALLDLVRPRVKVEPLSELARHYRRVPHKPSRVQDLMSVSLSSGELSDPAELALTTVADLSFLLELAHGLDAAVTKALDIGRRLLDPSGELLWRLGDLRRVYFAGRRHAANDDHDPDRFGTGIAPSVKLLHAVVERIAEVNFDAALLIVTQWRARGGPVYVRLWSAFARHSAYAPPEIVGAFLKEATADEFWNLHRFPEIAELRATRFSELDLSTQQTLVGRIRRGPPRSHWPRKADPREVDTARLYWSVRELRRIQVAGGQLSNADLQWLEPRLSQFADLRGMTSIDTGFLGASESGWVSAEPDERFEFLHGHERLSALEEALRSTRGWDSDPAGRAAAWLGSEGNAEKVVADLEAMQQADYPNIWDRFGWQHSPPQSPANTTSVSLADPLADRIAALLLRLDRATVKAAIQGLTRWLDTWQDRISDRAAFARAWHFLWPAAAATTNAEQAPEEEPSLSVVVQTSRDEPGDLDTLNTPAGRLVGAFLGACPTLVEASSNPFGDDGLRAMRDTALSAVGRTRLVVLHRLIEHLAYFLRADAVWTRERLVEPLLDDSDQAVPLWRAVARRTLSRGVLRIIGKETAQRATDLRLGRSSRQSLVFSIVVDTLHASRQGEDPAVPVPLVQQMLRSLDDEVRAYGANTVQRFVKDLSDYNVKAGEATSPESIFRSSVKPFLEEVWPQERSLATPGVARAFADLPYTCRDSFAEAVTVIERFLVPFDAWSLSDYGLRGAVPGGQRLSLIRTRSDAEALLKLLELTVGTSDGAIVPSDLAAALDQIALTSAALKDSQAFRRLTALANR